MSHKISPKANKCTFTREEWYIHLFNKIVYLDELPKTKSGKILRRLLRDLLEKKEKLGDFSTLINKDIVENIKKKI